MKSFKTYFLFLFAGINFCKAQEITLLISPAMFDKTTDQLLLGSKDGWYFKEGNDIVWAKKDVDITNWKKIKPIELTKKLADKNGKLEGWFRIKIKLDDSFKSTPLGLNVGTWAASDTYLDGQLLGSTGNTGINGEPFKENRYYVGEPIQIELSPKKEYTIAIHVVDYQSPFPPFWLKSESPTINGIIQLITLTGPKFISVREKQIIKEKMYGAIWAGVCTILSILFWLLYSQNFKERNLLLIALCLTFLTLNNFCNSTNLNLTHISYVIVQLNFYASSLFATLSFIMIPLILANVFKGKVTIYLKLFLTSFIIVYFIGNSLWLESKIITISIFMLYAVCIYFIFSSWKNLRGAQWAIVVGIMLTLFWLLMFVIYCDGTLKLPFALLYVTGTYLSFPLGLLVYVSLRFKEIINEVRENAQKVLQLSEEKKEHALYQQKILQEEVNKQTAELRNTLENLKSTQTQLIQSEKLASLGELTAGIAHEIQNPLNFVNNFSELSVDLAQELKEEVEKSDIDKELVSDLVSDLVQNQEKINHHGKRASGIVKGMLEHSRQSTGERELTDINQLADEYLRLSYHGLKAKDSSFNSDYQTDFDENLPKINVISQDMGRVLLNLINNAFWAVKTVEKPLVVVKTEQTDHQLIIKVIDNGLGMTEEVKAKIFQPFFTTKPTGQGTGLGLSLAYDIVTKGHAGMLTVETTEGEGTTFIVKLPT